MEITYLGHSSFRIKTKTATVITDPFNPDILGLKFPKVQADIVLVSHDHDDHNKIDLVEGYKKIIKGPGEYEVMDVSIVGYPSFHDNEKGSLRGKNTMYMIEAEGLSVAHLGDLGHELSEKQVEEIGHVDILMIPVGGEFTIGPTDAVKLFQIIEPHFVIPMHYKAEGIKEEINSKLSPLEAFLKESGAATETLPKFSVRTEDISEEAVPKIIVLERK